jgi:transcription elongation factor GreA
MTVDHPSRADITLAEALSEYLETLKPEQRRLQEAYVRKYVDAAGGSHLARDLSGARVESYSEAQIKASDPNAPDRVAALKAWFQFLKKKDYTTGNYGINVRARKMPGRAAPASATRRDETPVEMTADGIAILQKEQQDLEAQKAELVKAIEIARSDGDLRENAPYHAAREALAFAEQRFKRIEESLRRAVVADSLDDGKAAVGSTVSVVNVEEDKRFEYQLVSAREANAADRKISIESPVGKQLLGRRAGDEVAVSTPRGEVKFRVERVDR